MKYIVCGFISATATIESDREPSTMSIGPTVASSTDLPTIIGGAIAGMYAKNCLCVCLKICHTTLYHFRPVNSVFNSFFL